MFNEFVNVKMRADDLLDVLVERVKHWTDDAQKVALFEAMYENYIDGGCFDGMELDVMVVVDNDYINDCDVVAPGDEFYEVIDKTFKAEGLGDCSCVDGAGYSFIEAESNGVYLCRW